MRVVDILISFLVGSGRLPFGVGGFFVAGVIVLGLAGGCQGRGRLEPVTRVAAIDGNARIEVHAADAESAGRVLRLVGESVRAISARLEVGTPVKPLVVYAASSRSEKRRLLRQFSRRLKRLDGGCFFAEDRFVVVAGTPLEDAEDRYVLAHELVHYVLVTTVRPLDPWLDEGLAVYLGLAIEPDTTTIKRYSTHVRRTLRRSEDEWIEQLLTHRLGTPVTRDRDYAMAWAFVRFLVESRSDGRERMSALLSRLQEGGDELDALRTEFGMDDWADLDTAFRQWAGKDGEAEFSP